HEQAIAHSSAVVFRVEQVGKRRTAVCAIAIGIIFPSLGVFGQRPMAQADFALGRAEFNDLEFTVIAQLEPVLYILAIRIVEFGNVAQTFDAFIEFHKDSEWSMPHDSAPNDVAHTVSREELLPDIRL